MHLNSGVEVTLRPYFALDFLVSALFITSAFIVIHESVCTIFDSAFNNAMLSSHSGDLVWSKLDSGRLPSLNEVKSLVTDSFPDMHTSSNDFTS